MENISCSICNKDNVSPYLEIDNADISTPEHFNMVKCNYCNFIYLNPRVSANKINKYYDTNYTPYLSGNFFYSNAQYMFFRWKRYIIELHKKQGKLIDIGSGNNNFINYMNKNNWTADSFDKFSDSTIDLIDECEDNSYDVITLWHSIEHIHNLEEIFITMKRILTPNGLIFVACPNINSIDSKLLGKKWVAYDLPRHLYHFSYESFQKLADKYDIVIISYYRMIQDMFFNIIKTRDVNIIYKIILFAYSMIIITIFKKRSSSFLYVCKIK